MYTHLDKYIRMYVNVFLPPILHSPPPPVLHSPPPPVGRVRRAHIRRDSGEVPEGVCVQGPRQVPLPLPARGGECSGSMCILSNASCTLCLPSVLSRPGASPGTDYDGELNAQHNLSTHTCPLSPHPSSLTRLCQCLPHAVYVCMLHLSPSQSVDRL